jgi:hypothetical protein
LGKAAGAYHAARIRWGRNQQADLPGAARTNDFTSAAIPATCGVAGLVPVKPTYAGPTRGGLELSALVGVVFPNNTADQM